VVVANVYGRRLVMVRADIITSVFFMVLGAAIIEESWRMPRYTDVGGNIWTAPGIVPGMLGAALALMAFILFMRSLAARRAGAVDEPGEPGGWKRVAIAAGLCIAYGMILVGQMPFWLATFIFVFVFIAYFELANEEARAHWLRHIVVAAIIAALTGGTVTYIFQNIFFVRLP
jgi:hypothetical protein